MQTLMAVTTDIVVFVVECNVVIDLFVFEYLPTSVDFYPYRTKIVRSQPLVLTVSKILFC